VLAVEVGAAGAIGGQPEAQVALQAGAGMAVAAGDARLEALAVARWVTPIDVTSAGREVVLDEVAAGVGVRGSLRWGRFGAGIELEPGVRFIDARGRSPDGRTGSLFRVVPVARGGLSARAVLAPRIELRVFAGVEVALIRQRFSVLGERVVDLGRARGVCDISLVVSAP